MKINLFSKNSAINVTKITYLQISGTKSIQGKKVFYVLVRHFSYLKITSTRNDMIFLPKVIFDIS